MLPTKSSRRKCGVPSGATRAATSTGRGGDFKLQVTAFVPAHEACDIAAPNCAPNLECRSVSNGAAETCEQPITGPSCDDQGSLRTKIVPTAGDLAINEYMADPSAVRDAAGEWFEAKVNSNVDIGGLQMGRAEVDGPGSVLLTLNPTACCARTQTTQMLCDDSWFHCDSKATQRPRERGFGTLQFRQ